MCLNWHCVWCGVGQGPTFQHEPTRKRECVRTRAKDTNTVGDCVGCKGPFYTSLWAVHVPRTVLLVCVYMHSEYKRRAEREREKNHQTKPIKHDTHYTETHIHTPAAIVCVFVCVYGELEPPDQSTSSRSFAIRWLTTVRLQAQDGDVHGQLRRQRTHTEKRFASTVTTHHTPCELGNGFSAARYLNVNQLAPYPGG